MWGGGRGEGRGKRSRQTEKNHAETQGENTDTERAGQRPRGQEKRDIQGDRHGGWGGEGRQTTPGGPVSF